MPYIVPEFSTGSHDWGDGAGVGRTLGDEVGWGVGDWGDGAGVGRTLGDEVG